MTSGDNGKRAGRSVSASILIGTLLVPLSAYAASVLIDRPQQSDPQPEVTVSSTPAVVEATVDPMAATAEDLAAACGEVGLQMVEAETNGSITEVQQAALDALRQVCADQGSPLPAKPVPQPVTDTVVVAGTQPLPDDSVGGASAQRDDDDDHHGDDEARTEDHGEEEDD
jgi:hypothetical protein